jgi:sugar-specific transcriptional regulator TrmB
MELIDLLIANNFSEKEAKTYLACLELKTANASTISRYTKEKRSTTYSVIKELQKK